MQFSTPTEVFSNFTGPWNGNVNIYRQLEYFAKSLGWYPSDIVEEKDPNSLFRGHLFVEHGLENSAVISFLNSDYFYDNLTSLQQTSLLNISYNNLVDLHISVDIKKVHGLHNRIQNATPFYSGFISKNFDNLRSSFYSDLFEDKKFRTNIVALDDALINTISYWKRLLSSELQSQNINEELSNLFNSLIFCRAIEDNRNRVTGNYQKELISSLYENSGSNLIKIIEHIFKKFEINKWPANLVDKEKLSLFNSLDERILFELFSDFYLIKNTPYRYDFSIISKHALSRIYERYVSILKVEETPQLSFFAPLPIEHKNKSSGSYYTPQFIARFFSRYIELKHPKYKSSILRILEPSVGSGIFLRTILEQMSDTYNSAFIEMSFENVEGYDINPTACQASKLSLALLHLSLTSKLPAKDLKIISTNSLRFFRDSKKYSSVYDICISNPPFVAYNALSSEERADIQALLGDQAFGRSDLYLPFIKIAIDALKVNGFAFFVLPNTFLISNSAKKIRKYLTDNAFIHCVVDLSEIQVFDDTGIYPILLIFEKNNPALIQKKEVYGSKPLATIAKIQGNIGKALTELLMGIKVESPEYTIYDVNQEYFQNESWYLIPPSEYFLKTRLDGLPKLQSVADVRTGFSSGAGDVFVIDKKDIPKGEASIYVPYLNDREMRSYVVPKKSTSYLFYPFKNNSLISEKELRKEFPETYKRLQTKKRKLSARKEVMEKKLAWWAPQRPRKPDFMMVPKITTPHLVLTPKFSIDVHGKYAVSRTPFVVLNDVNSNVDLLYFLCAVLNSSVCFWYLFKHTPKYQNGYAMLEKKHLLDLPIPLISKADNKVQQLIKLVKERMISKAEDSIDIEKKIDRLVTKLYGLSEEEIKFLNLDEDGNHLH